MLAFPPRFPPGARHIALALAFLCAFPAAALAWSDHTLCTWQAVAPLADLAGATVAAEPLDAFLVAEAARLPAVLDGEETWARAHVPHYAPRPDALAFRPPAGGPPDGATLRRAFLHAIRANEAVPLNLYVQRRPGVVVPADRVMDWPALTVLKRLSDTDNHSLERLDPGERVAVDDVIATASNEPDFGLDIGLWQDNGQPQGALYGYGRQPFGNPRLDYGSQAPFHMGFYHEAAIVNRAAPNLLRTYPEARIHLAMTLARFAFAQGHPYWGWRFTGWAIHYVQDLGQPYHARVLPGVGVPRLLWINLLDMAGIHGPKWDAVNLVTNRHTVLENYQYRHMLAAYGRGDMADPLLAALRDTSGDAGLERLGDGAPRGVVSAQSAAAADALDAQLERTFPPVDVSDPTTVLGDDIDMDKVAARAPLREQSRLTALLADRMRQVGRDTRAVIRAVEPPAAP